MHIAAAIICYLGVIGVGATFIGRDRKTFWQSYATGLLITLPLLCLVGLGVYAASGLKP